MNYNIGARRELFIDDWLIDSMQGTSLLLHKPERREVAMCMDNPWEDSVMFPLRLLPWDNSWRLYYRAGILDLDHEDDTTVIALAESRDGFMFTRPDLGVCEFRNSKHNNILRIGGYPNVPPPFFDTNPACSPEQRFKGITARASVPYAMASPDGIHWTPMQEQPLDLHGQFDTINTAFWDSLVGCYRCYTRRWHDPATGYALEGWDWNGVKAIRGIQHATSRDFLHWSTPEQLQYADGNLGTHLYTNAILPCPGAEHIYLGFPNRYLPERTPYPAHGEEGVNDALFMSSRDGVHWTRWLDAWVNPGLDPLNWTERNNYPVWGIAKTSPEEWSMYITEHYRYAPEPSRIRRLAIRPWGFVSVHAGYSGGEMVTKAFSFTGSELHLNARTSAAGSIQVEIQDEDRRPLPDFALEDMLPWFGDSIDAPMAWKCGKDLSYLTGQSIRMRFLLKDADLFALQFTE